MSGAHDENRREEMKKNAAVIFLVALAALPAAGE